MVFLRLSLVSKAYIRALSLLSLLAMLICYQPYNVNAAKIIAIVGDTAITDYDVDQRARVVAMLQKYNVKDKALMKQVRKEIVAVLIDEEIKKSFAKKAKMEIKKEVIESFILQYGEKTGSTTLQQIKNTVKIYGIDWSFFWNIVADEITWSQLVYYGLSNSIQFSESEIEQRAIMEGLDPTNYDHLEAVKRNMMEERLALDVQKMISRMKRFRVVEEIKSGN
ncbi:MAG: SurA N-terminal domain-containing protein [Alphaproteobacteria bacterium]|nr:SurA N-terminal domain-containing protein [Rickettsiales bacterium]